MNEKDIKRLKYNIQGVNNDIRHLEYKVKMMELELESIKSIISYM
jgi:hypothetical protein